MSKSAEISTLSFEQARDELAEVVQTLESGGHTREDRRRFCDYVGLAAV